MTIEERIYDYIDEHKNDSSVDITPTYIRLSNITVFDHDGIIIHLNKYLIKIGDELFKTKYDRVNIFFYVVNNIDSIHYYKFDDKMRQNLLAQKRDEFIDSLIII